MIYNDIARFTHNDIDLSVNDITRFTRNDMIFPPVILRQQNIIALAISFVKRISFPLGNIIVNKKKSQK